MYVCIYEQFVKNYHILRSFISQKLPGKGQDFPKFGKFPSKWKHYMHAHGVDRDAS